MLPFRSIQSFIHGSNMSCTDALCVSLATLCIVIRRYLKVGAPFEVVSLPVAMRAKIQDELSFPMDDLFAELQAEAYSYMLFDLFPRFWEACKEAPKEARVSKVNA